MTVVRQAHHERGASERCFDCASGSAQHDKARAAPRRRFTLSLTLSRRGGGDPRDVSASLNNGGLRST